MEQPQTTSYSYQNQPPAAGKPTYFDNIDGVEKPMPEANGRKKLVIMGYQLDQELLVSKLFYLFFYAAFGSLFPLIAVYFKQLGMNATQAGLLIGIRPFIEFASCPFWGSFADKFRRGRALLLFSLVCWIVFTVAIRLVKPNTAHCLLWAGNDTAVRYKLVKAGPETAALRFGGIFGTKLPHQQQANGRLFMPMPKPDTDNMPGMAPIQINEKQVLDYSAEEEGRLVRPPGSVRIYKKSGVEQVWLLLLLLVCLAEFLSTPAATLADACTLGSLGERRSELFGQQRLFGSAGWAVAMFLVGLGLDRSDAFPNHPCGVVVNEKNYTLCFAAFSVLMMAALLIATQFTFHSDSDRPDEVAHKIMDIEMSKVDAAVAENARARGLPANSGTDDVSAGGPEWLQVLKAFGRSPPHAVFLAVTCWMGFGVGLVFAFLFWHLQDLGGSPTLFGMASVINHVSEVCAYCFTFRLINRFGHVKVLYVGLAANCCRFFYVSWLSDPWWVLPFEFVQGLTHAAVWAAATSYISLAAPASDKQAAQYLLQGLHHGVGRGCGALLSGFCITYIGTAKVFQIYGAVCLVVLALYLLVNRRWKADGVKYQNADFLETDEGAGALAPHGIPMAVPYGSKGDGGSTASGPAPPEPDPTQDAYDRYIHQPYEQQPARFEPLPLPTGRPPTTTLTHSQKQANKGAIS